MTTTPTDLLKGRDYTLIVDKSGSMGFNSDTPSGATRWKAAQEATLGLAAKISELDADGITFYAFNSQYKRHENVTAASVANLWNEHEPNGGTQLAAVLTHAFDSYFARRSAGTAKPNGETILVVTDGQPEDGNAVRTAIVAATNKMTRDEELSVSFIQVGKDREATAFLSHLDNELKGAGAKYDIVDAMSIEEMGTRSLTDVLLSSITD